MKVKLVEIVNSKESIQNLLNTKLPIKTSYALNKLAISVNPELEIYEKKRIELVKEFGEKNPDDDNFTVTKENMEKFAEKLNELLQIEINVDFKKLKLEDLGNIEIEPTNLPIWILE